MNNHIVIAIDGGSASGKSTTARLVAEALGFLHVDTGAMFRTLAWHCLKTGTEPHDAAATARLCAQWKTSLHEANGAVRLLVDGRDPGDEIRAATVSAATPLVAASPKVRAWMKATQRHCLEFGSLVMEGRDIGTHIFPEARFKFYLNASLAERTRRRAAQGIVENIAARDEHDTRRSVAPLKIADDAVVIDNSGLTARQTADLILDRVKKEAAPA